MGCLLHVVSISSVMFGVGLALHAEEMTKVGDPQFSGIPNPLSRTMRSLVVVEDSQIQNTHSLFLTHLRDEGHDLTVKLVSDRAIVLVDFSGESMFDNIILLAPSLSAFPLNSTLSEENLLKFVDSHEGSVFVAGGMPKYVKLSDDSWTTVYSTGAAIRSFANACGVDFDVESSVVMDLVSKAPGGATGNGASRWPAANSFFASELLDVPHIISPLATGSQGILFSGMGMAIENDSSVLPFLRGNPTSYSMSPTGTPDIVATGSDVVLVGAMQALNNARVLFTGSFDMLSDKHLTRFEESKRFVDEMATWTFKRSGMITWSNMGHNKIGDSMPSEMYRIKDDIEFHVDLWKLGSSVNVNDEYTWEPFLADDVQLEHTMLHPHTRIWLEPELGVYNGDVALQRATYRASFKLSDRPGVFKHVVKYQRLGYNTIHFETLAPQRNFRHNDYERFLGVAAPYYGSCISILLAFFALVVVQLHHKPSKIE